MTDLVTVVVTGLLSGSLFGAGASLVTSRAIARKTGAETDAIGAKLPAEVDSVVVQGATAAVLTMKQALDSAVSRIQQLEDERADDRRTIEQLQRQVRELRDKVSAAERATAAARTAGEELGRRIEAILRDQEGRR